MINNKKNPLVRCTLIRNLNFTTFSFFFLVVVIMKSNKFYSQVNQIVDISSVFDDTHIRYHYTNISQNKQKG